MKSSLVWAGEKTSGKWTETVQDPGIRRLAGVRPSVESPSCVRLQEESEKRRNAPLKEFTGRKYGQEDKNTPRRSGNMQMSGPHGSFRQNTSFILCLIFSV